MLELSDRFLKLLNRFLQPEQDTSGFPEPRPELPLASYGLAFGMIIGLIALWLAAYDAFSKTGTPLHAFFNSAVIEFGGVVEAIALARARSWKDAILAFLAVLVSLVVSVTYNYVQVSAFGASHGVTDRWQLYTFALGPLAALTFVNINLGRNLRELETLTAEWNTKRTNWINLSAAQKLAQLKSEQEKRERAQAEREKLEREIAAQQAAEQARREFEEREAQRAHERKLRKIENSRGEKNGEKFSDNYQGDKANDKSRNAWVKAYMKETGLSQAQAYRDYKKKFGK